MKAEREKAGMKKPLKNKINLSILFLIAAFLLTAGETSEIIPQIPPRPKTLFKPQGDFSVLLLGTASPLFTPERASQSTLVQYKGNFFLVDMGNGTQLRLKEAQIIPGDIETFMLTHHHIDHNEEYIPLSIHSWMSGRKHLNLIGPPRTKALHEFLTRFYIEDMEYRKDLRKQPWNWDGIITNVDIKEVNGDESFIINGVKITTTEVPHSIHTQAYRFDADGKSIVISGDLTYSENLIKLAKDADILILDARVVVKSPGGERRPLPVKNDAHSTLEECARMAQKAGVKKLVLSHITCLEVLDEEATLEAYRKIYTGEIIIGKDLMEILP